MQLVTILLSEIVSDGGVTLRHRLILCIQGDNIILSEVYGQALAHNARTSMIFFQWNRLTYATYCYAIKKYAGWTIIYLQLASHF